MAERLDRKIGENQVIDFCHQIIGTDIECDTSCQDGFNPRNLTSSNLLLKNTGFLVNYFVRPPVNLTLKFDHPIWISHMVFDAQVGQQKSKGFDIFVNGQVRVARFYNHLPTRTTVFFQNFAFPGNAFKHAEDGDKIRLGQTHELKNVTALGIRIFATESISVPCLANLQIWGRISDCVKEEARLEINSIWSALQLAKLPPANVVENRKRKNDSDLAKLEDSSAVPDEFLDALTCKRMNIPMLLPCGQYVDRSSLDNYIDIEKNWGRSPNDPFTGVIFTDSRKPVFDAKLKSRIDAFVLGVNNAAPSTSAHVIKKAKVKTEESSFAFNGGNLDALLNEALKSSCKDPIIGRKKQHQRSCRKCAKFEDLYASNCCKEEIFLCKSCLLSNKFEPLEQCQMCKKTRTKRDFFKFHQLQQ